MLANIRHRNTGGCSPQKIPKNPKKTQSQFTDFGVATGIFWDFLGFFWDFLGFLGFFGFFWDFLGFFWDFLGFFGICFGIFKVFWLEVSDGLKFGKQLFVGNPCIQ